MRQRTRQPQRASGGLTDKPLVFDAYVRVSAVRGRSGESFISPAIQRERIAAWAQAHDYRIARVWEELDVSGGTTDRPKLNEVMRRIEAGETGGIVVFKLDRFGRTLIDSLELIERIQSARATFASVSDGFDLSTETGRLVLKIMLSLAEFELERIRANWADARERAVARGLHLSAMVPFGYRRGGDGVLEPHAVNGPIVTEMFKKKAAGMGWADLGRWLESKGARTQRGRTFWTLRAMRDIVQSEVYLGVASHGEFRNEDAHEALTDLVTWRRAQRRGRQTRSRASEPALLAGLIRCAGCRYAMRAATRRLKDERIVHDYRCRCAADLAGRCLEPATATGIDRIEEDVVERFFAKVEDVRAAAVLDGSRLPELQAVVDRAQAALDEYAADTRVQAAIGMDAYVAGLHARKAAYDAARETYEEECDAGGAVAIDLAGSLRQDWGTLSVDERRRLLGLAIDCVFVRRRVKDEPLARRTHICWRGEGPGPSDLPTKGGRVFTPRPYVYPDPVDPGEALREYREVAGGNGVTDLAV